MKTDTQDVIGTGIIRGTVTLQPVCVEIRFRNDDWHDARARMSRLRLLAMWALDCWSPSVCATRCWRDGVASGLGLHVPNRPRGYYAGVPTLREALLGRFDP